MREEGEGGGVREVSKVQIWIRNRIRGKYIGSGSDKITSIRIRIPVYDIQYYDGENYDVNKKYIFEYSLKQISDLWSWILNVSGRGSLITVTLLDSIDM